MRLRLVVTLATAGTAALLVVAPAAQAGPRVRTPHFAGFAPGTVSCTATVTVRFSPAMTNARVPNNVKALGTFKSCTASTSGVVVTGVLGKLAKGYVSTAFTQSPLNCSGSPSAGSDFTITWRGTFSGMVGSLTFSGRALFDPSNIEPATDTPGETETTNGAGDAGITLPAQAVTGGSFQNQIDHPSASGAMYSQYTPAQLASMCAGSGIKMLKFVGTVDLG